MQLRALWKVCHQQLSTFATDLTRQQEAREIAKHKADTDAAKNARLADVDRRLEEAAAEADAQRRNLAEVQSEIDRLRSSCEYRNNADTVPTADSVAPSAADIDLSKNAKPAPAANWNVLAEDYWDLYTLLLR